MKRTKGQHRKRVSRDIPPKSRLRKFADDLWSLAVRADWAGKCAVCGKPKCEAHHVIPRQHEATRYELRNGIALCSWDHQWNPDTAPHANAAGWLLWLSAHYPELHQWCIDTTANGQHKTFDGKVTPSYFCDQILRLKEYVPEDDYERIIGKRFAKWLKTEEA